MTFPSIQSSDPSPQGQRLLAFAFENWENQLLARMLMREETARCFPHRLLAISDTTTLLYEPGELSALRRACDFPVIDLSHLWARWQDPDPAPEPRLDPMNWVDWTQSSWTPRQLTRTLQQAYAFEWERMHLPTSSGWKAVIVADQLAELARLLQDYSPTHLLRIEGRSFMGNAAALWAAEQGRPMITMNRARVDSRWTFIDYFGYSKSPLQTLREATVADEEALAAVATESKRLLSRGGLYAPSHQGQSLRDSEPLSSVWIKRLRSVGSRHTRGGRRSWKREVRRFEQDFLRLSMLELRRTMVQSLERFGMVPLITTSIPKGQLIAWFLHNRPEDSVTVLGSGLTDEEGIKQLSQRIPDGWRVLVKEHPMMLGMRPSGYYRRLSESGPVQILSPRVPTLSIMAGVKGVAGLSGTALLEATILGVPAIALGIPEFAHVLPFQGSQDISRFVERCRLSEDHRFGEDETIAVGRYLKWIYANSFESDLPPGTDLESDEGARLVESLGSRFLECVEVLGRDR